MSGPGAENGVPPSALPRSFRPAWWARGPHQQTLAGRALRALDGIELRRERWQTPDGDFLDLDFGPDPDPHRPRVLVLHGLEGSARRGYCIQSYRALTARGVAPIGLNFRSCSGEPNRRARAYHSGETGDLGWVIDRLRSQAPDRRLGILGFSLGGNVLLKYLGEQSEEAGGSLTGAVAVSVPYDLAAGAAHLERGPMRRAYARFFLRSLRAKTREKTHLVSELVDLEGLDRTRTLRDFDELLTAPVHGFDDADHYYRASSSVGFLERVRVPTLLLHSLDDPFLPREAIPVDAIARNPRLHLVLTPRGGHVGFVMGGPRRPRFWAEEAGARFLAEVLASP